jgi:hypothetical protein
MKQKNKEIALASLGVVFVFGIFLMSFFYPSPEINSYFLIILIVIVAIGVAPK